MKSAHCTSSVENRDQPPTPVLENYLHQCSMQVTCRDFGIIAATLANGRLLPGTWQGIYLWARRADVHLREVVVTVKG